MRGVFLVVVTVFSARRLRLWCGFFPAPGVSGTVIDPSVDVDDGGAGG